jgi:hypothetical protein
MDDCCMAIFALENGLINKVQSTSFVNESILERAHLQNALKQNIEVIAADCLIISEEYAEWDSSRKRIDLLAVDKQANLIIFELKRTDTGDHMELQAIRYASMISTMTYDHALSVFVDYKLRNGCSDFTKEEAVEVFESFFEIEVNETNFANDVRIILVSAEFSKELTTTVMWLNERDLDITCVRMKPYNYQGNILIDIQQVIPLPEAKDYQVRAQKKAEERRENIKELNSRDYSKYLFNDLELNKRKLVLELIKTHIKQKNISSFNQLLLDFPQELRSGRKMFKKYDEIKNSNEKTRYFIDDNEKLNFEDGTYVISNQWGSGNIQAILDQAELLGYDITILVDNESVAQEIEYNGYLIQQLSNLTIRIFKNNIEESIVKPILRGIAREIDVNINNSKGNEKNTRTLGADIIRKVSERKKDIEK